MSIISFFYTLLFNPPGIDPGIKYEIRIPLQFLLIPVGILFPARQIYFRSKSQKSQAKEARKILGGKKNIKGTGRMWSIGATRS